MNFEVKGWDVVFTITPARIGLRLAKLPPCTCRCDHDECGEGTRCRGGHGYCKHSCCQGRDISGTGKTKTDSYYHCAERCPWSSSDTGAWLLKEARTYWPDHSPTIRVELKPDLGDDYLAVLRQVKRYPPEGYGHPQRSCVVARRHAFESVTWDQVRKIYAASSIALIAESEIAAAADPE